MGFGLRLPRVLLALFFLSGFVGVLVEQIFERLLSVVVGSTTAASANVLAIYFGGFFSGGCLAGLIVRKRRVNPLLAYGCAELAVALSSLLVLMFFDVAAREAAPLLASRNLGQWAHVASRLLVSFPVVFPAAFAMGASFPFLSGIATVVSPVRSSSYIAGLYTVNLFGAAAAAVVAPYCIFPFLGLSGGLVISAVTDAGVALAAFWFARSAEVSSVPQPSGVFRLRARHVPILAIALGSGLIFFTLEVTWTYLIAAVVNNSVYAFSSMLFFVLLGLGLGSNAVTRLMVKDQSGSNLAFLFIACSGMLLIQTLYWPSIPRSMASIGKYASTFMMGELVRWIHIAFLLLPPTFLFGMIYPSLFGGDRLKEPGSSALVGFLTAANAVGSILGAVLAFFVFIPILGVETTLRLAAAGPAICGLVMLSVEHRFRAMKPALGVCLLLALLLWKLPPWDRLQLTSGLNIYFGYQFVKSSTRLLYYGEHVDGGFTTVVENTDNGSPVKTLLTNGKFQGDDGAQMEAQTAFTAIPTMHLGTRDRALNIGFGTGQSAGMLADFGFRHIDVAELSPSILAASRQHFRDANGGILENPRTTIYLEDGRNLLLTHSQKYDLISIEITSVWFSGATNVYSKAFYNVAKSRLSPGGALQQWVQLHHISPREIDSILGTVRSTFPYTSFWLFGEQGIIVGTVLPQQLTDLGQQWVYASLLDRFGGDQTKARGYFDRLKSSLILDSTGIDRLLAANQPPVINDDWNRWLEYRTPRYMISRENWLGINVAHLTAYGTPKGGRP